MHERNDTTGIDNPLRHLTPAQFMALGGNAVVYIKPMTGDRLAEMMDDPQLAEDEEFHLVVSADGSPLLIADSSDTVTEWLSDKNYGIVALH
jgi:hypothetical protein